MSDIDAATAVPPFAPSRFRLQPDRKAEAARRRRMMRDLDRAIAADTPSQQFWPRLALHNDALIAVEASWRWSHRRHGVLPGAVLTALAGDTKLGERLAIWSLLRACRTAATWRSNCVLSLRIPSVLLPAVRLLLQVEAVLAESGLEPERLELRLTEDQLAAMQAADILALSSLRDLGVGIALAQFGTGETSLGLLRRVPVSTVIVAADLLRHLPRDREDGSMLHAILHAAKGLGLSSVACGVERQAQRDFLTGLGCEAVQGPLLSATSAWSTQLTPC